MKCLSCLGLLLHKLNIITSSNLEKWAMAVGYMYSLVISMSITLFAVLQFLFMLFLKLLFVFTSCTILAFTIVIHFKYTMKLMYSVSQCITSEMGKKSF